MPFLDAVYTACCYIHAAGDDAAVAAAVVAAVAVAAAEEKLLRYQNMRGTMAQDSRQESLMRRLLRLVPVLLLPRSDSHA